MDSFSNAEQLVAAMPSITLDMLGNATLLNRIDSKFLVPAVDLPALLTACANDYHALSVDHQRVCRYETVYFDTPTLELYRAHHAGRTSRRKVRTRTYVDSAIRFLEVKVRSNTGRTVKHRVGVPVSETAPLTYLSRLTGDGLDGLLSSELEPVVTTRFRRITLVRHAAAERVTFDVALECLLGDATARYPGIVIAEVKQDRAGSSPALAALRAMRIREGSLSKYCIGVVALHPTARTNLLKAAYQRLVTLDRANFDFAHAV